MYNLINKIIKLLKWKKKKGKITFKVLISILGAYLN